MSALLARYNAEKKAFGRLKKLCESKVVRWDYWDWHKWSWDPEDCVLLSLQAKKVPRAKAEYAYGYDKAGRVIVIHDYPIGKPNTPRAMQFLRYSGNKIIGSKFFPGQSIRSEGRVVGWDSAAGGTLVNVFEATLSDGRIVRVEQLMGNPVLGDCKTIEWRDGRVARILLSFRGRKPHLERTYGTTGKVIDEVDLSKPAKRKPLPKGVTMNSLAKEIRERLAKVVVETVTKAKIKEPAYCLALNYDCEGNPLLLPELGIGLESNRCALLKRGGRDAKLDIWDAVNFPMFGSSRTALAGRDKKLDQACDLYNRELEYKGSDAPARKLILQVAADLAKMDWKGKLNTTDDFIVYAVDTDGVDLRKNLKLSVPAKQMAKLRSARLI